MNRQNVAVLVFGDIGRSPRIQNHALMLAEYYNVYLVGDKDTEVFPEISDNKNIRIVDLRSKLIEQARKTLFYYLYVMVRIIIQTLMLLGTFIFKLKPLKFVIVQNPPCIPVLGVLWFASLIRRFEVVVDFHNYGHTILELSNKNKLVVALAKWYEKFFARRAHKHLCVSGTMLKHLKNEWGISAMELRDEPTKRSIVNISEVEKEQVLERVTGIKRQGNELIIVSSTSWTKDEDFGVLLKAVQNYQQQWTEKMPQLRVYITGKGPQKEEYEKYIREQEVQWKHITVKTLWLSHKDYPLFLASCDVGVCLHYSSSGLDLPMKVVDMLSAGIPVLALKYESIHELVQQPYNGYVFESSGELCTRITELAVRRQQVRKMSDFIKSVRSNSFQREWKSVFEKLKLLPVGAN